jgi:hypothetical protein
VLSHLVIDTGETEKETGGSGHRPTPTSGARANVERTHFNPSDTDAAPSRSRPSLLDFLPATEERLIRRDGIRMFHLHYWDNVLSLLAGRSQERFIVKHDPRNLSCVYLRDEGRLLHLLYRDLGAPPITLWSIATRSKSCTRWPEMCRRKAGLSNNQRGGRTDCGSQAANAVGRVTRTRGALRRN